MINLLLLLIWLAISQGGQCIFQEVGKFSSERIDEPPAEKMESFDRGFDAISEMYIDKAEIKSTGIFSDLDGFEAKSWYYSTDPIPFLLSRQKN